MKRILFDQQIFRNQNYGGISRYFTKLIRGVGKENGFEVLPKKFFSANDYLAANRLNNFNWFRKDSRIAERVILRLEDHRMANRLKNGRFDVFHPTYYSPAFLNHIQKNKPFVLTVHDMIHENYYDKREEYLSMETKYKRALIPKAAHIITVSEHTKKQLLELFPGVNERKISVIYHGTDFQLQPPTEKPAGLPGKYILFVGIKKHYKNFFWLAKALGEYLRQTGTDLLCAGGFDFDEYEQEFLATGGLTQHVWHIAVNSDPELAALYRHAECLVYPSLMEGFGIPLIEAFACGCPVILSRSSCFPEIAGDAALYFEPGDREDLLKKIGMVQDEGIRSALLTKGKERAKMFTWEQCVGRHLELYRSLAN